MDWEKACAQSGFFLMLASELGVVRRSRSLSGDGLF